MHRFVWIDPNFFDLYPNSIQTGGVVQFWRGTGQPWLPCLSTTGVRASVELCKNIPDLKIIEIRGFYFMPQKLLNLIV